MKVLLADDEDDIRILYRMMLDRMGCEVVVAADGGEALAVLDREPVDVVLLDLRMPGIDGWGVMERIRAEGRHPDVRIVAVSAHADPALMERATAAGATAYLVKPFRPEELWRVLERITS